MPQFDEATAGLATTLNQTDEFGVMQGGSYKNITAHNLRKDMASNSRWRPLLTSEYTATPATTSTVTVVSGTSNFKQGSPVRYKYGGTTYYGICTAITSSLLTIAGATLDTGTDLTELAVGQPDLVVIKRVYVAAVYNGAVQNILENTTEEVLLWQHGKAYAVRYSGAQGTNDTGTESFVNLQIAASAVGTENTNNGIQMSSSGGSFVHSSAVAINTSQYEIDFGDSIEFRVTDVTGSNNDAAKATFQAVFVLE